MVIPSPPVLPAGGRISLLARGDVGHALAEVGPPAAGERGERNEREGEGTAEAHATASGITFRALAGVRRVRASRAPARSPARGTLPPSQDHRSPAHAEGTHLSKSKDSRKEVVDAFKNLIARIGEIFGVFDLSFFVAGVVCLGAIIFGAYVFGARWASHVKLGAWGAAHVVAAVLASYVLGMVCFSLGRTVGRRFRRDRRLHAQLRSHLIRFGLEPRYGSLLPSAKDPHAEDRYSLLYTRLWAEVRQTQELAPSFNLVTRYWVMAAMCDGLAAAFAIWTVIWAFWATSSGTVPHPSTQILVLGGVGLAGAALLCFVEALRYSEYQMYEVVATLAYHHVPVPQQPQSALVVPALVAPPRRGGEEGRSREGVRRLRGSALPRPPSRRYARP